MHFTTLRMFRNADPRWVEFRGEGIQAFVLPEQWGTLRPTDAQLVHDSMLGWHTCVLYAAEPGERVAVCEHHEDFEIVRQMWEYGNA